MKLVAIMRQSVTLSQLLATLGALAGFAGQTRSAPALLPSIVKPSTIAVWEKAGAEFGYMRTQDDGSIGFEAELRRPGGSGLPAFIVHWSELPYCAGLPGPEAPFALIVSGSDSDKSGRKRPSPKEAPAGLVDIDVTNLLRLRYLKLGSAAANDSLRLLNGLQRLQQLETLELSSPAKEFLAKLKDAPRMPSLKTFSVESNFSDDDLPLIGELKQLTHLRIFSSHNPEPVSPKGLRHLVGLPVLRAVNVRSAGITDEHLLEIVKIPELRELDISDCWKVTERGLNLLSRAKHLESLNTSKGPPIDHRWTDAGKLTALRRLRIDGKNVFDSGLKSIAAISDLRELTLSSCEVVTDAGFAYLGSHGKLQSLVLMWLPNLAENAMKAIGSLRALRSLRVIYCPKVPETAPLHLSRLLDLRQLELKGCDEIKDEGVKNLARLQALEELELWDSQGVTEKCIPSVCKLVNLRVLSFYRNDFVQGDDRDMAAIAGLRHLRRLSLSRCERVTTEGYQPITKLPELESLVMLDCHGLTNANLKSLAASRQLRELYLTMTPQVTDAGLSHLTELRLWRLSISGCEKITPDGISDFRRACPRCNLNVLSMWKPDARRVKPK